MIRLKICLYLICHDDVAKVILFYQIKDKKSLKVEHESLKNVFRPGLYQFFFLHLHLDKLRQKMDRINSY